MESCNGTCLSVSISQQVFVCMKKASTHAHKSCICVSCGVIKQGVCLIPCPCRSRVKSRARSPLASSLVPLLPALILAIEHGQMLPAQKEALLEDGSVAPKHSCSTVSFTDHNSESASSSPPSFPLWSLWEMRFILFVVFSFLIKAGQGLTFPCLPLPLCDN